MVQQTVKKKIRVLALCDYTCSTGFATVSSNIMRELFKMGDFEVDVVAINGTGDPYDYEKFPFRVYPAVTIETLHRNPSMDVYGRDKFLTMVGDGVYDVIFMIQDTFIIQTVIDKMLEIIESLEHKPKTIFYYPIDATPDPAWITDVVAKIDYPVPYTNYARNESLAVCEIPQLQDPLYHGTNVKEFFYEEDRDLVKTFRHEWFDRGWADDKFVVMNLNRNQPRKDILRSLQVLKCLRDLGDDTVFYFHMQYQDAGGNIIKQAEQLGLEIGKDFVLPHPRVFNSHSGVDIETLNMIYNATDAVITTTHGEGWGLSVTEAMATRRPVIAPDNTSLTEMLADNRGILVPCGTSAEAWVVKQDDNDRIRPIVNVDLFAKAILELKSGKTIPDIDKAEKWVHKYTWNTICKKWGALFLEAGRLAQVETKERLLKAEKQSTKKLKPKVNRKKERQNRKKARR